MQASRHVLIVTILAAALPLANGEPAAAAPTAPSASAPAASPTATPPKAKSPPRAPTLLSVSPTGAGQNGSVNPALMPGASASAAIDAPRMISQIQAAPLTARDALLREVGIHLDASQRALLALRDRASLVGQRTGNTFVFQRALADARTSELSLRKSLQAARDSTTPATWTTAQNDLKQSYGAYAKAVADVEAAWKNPGVLPR